MKIKPLKNPVCGKCNYFYKKNRANYQWHCDACSTTYSAQKYKKGEKEWFEYKPTEQESFDSPMGVSRWRNHGEKYGYWKYFETEIKKNLCN